MENEDNLQTYFLYCHHWSCKKWKSSMAGGGGNKKRFQYCTDSSGAILYLRALQGHSGRSLIGPALEDNVIIPDGFFKYIYHTGCAINVHSTTNSGLIDTRRSQFEQQTVFFLLLEPMDKNHKDPDKIDLKAPRRAQHLHKAWKKHQITVYSVDINLAQKKGLKFHQTPSSLHPDSCSDGNWRCHEKVHASPRSPPKISLKHNWMKELGSEVVRQPEGEVVQQSKSSQSSQPNPNPNHDRTVKPVVCPQRGASRSQEIETRSFREEAVKHDRTEKPFVCRD